MSSHIPEEFITQLVSRLDIVDVVQARLPLKKAGREFTACCPFHNEKTPSFTVSPNKQFYHCFGCGAHGSVINFVMEYDRLGFVDAVEELASQSGMEVPLARDADKLKQQSSLYDVLTKASQFYCRQLKQPLHGQIAIDYLKKRGLSGEIAVDFAIGFAPAGWDNLLSSFTASGISEKQLSAAGLIISKDAGGYYDRFRERIMFPIRDRRGRVIAFGGRVLANDNPKYLNSPETSVFHKGKELYGLYEARKHAQLESVLVVEGYMDVVSLAQHGVRNAVATLGTATSSDHVETLFRAVPEIVFCFDGDRAGRQAAWRALENAIPLMRDGRQVKFMFLEEGEDPDTYVQRHGKDTFIKTVAQAQPLSAYFIDHLSRGLDVQSTEGGSALIERAKPFLLKLPEGIYQELLIQKLSKIIHMNVEKLSKLIFPIREPLSQNGAKNNKLASSPIRQAVRLLLEHPQLAQSVSVDQLKGLEIPGQKLLVQLINLLKENPHMTCGAVIEHWRDQEQASHLVKLSQIPITIPFDGIESEFKDTMIRLNQFRIEQRIDKLLEKTQKVGLDSEEKRELQGLYVEKSQ